MLLAFVNAVYPLSRLNCKINHLTLYLLLKHLQGYYNNLYKCHYLSLYLDQYLRAIVLCLRHTIFLGHCVIYLLFQSTFQKKNFEYQVQTTMDFLTTFYHFWSVNNH